MQKIQTKDMKQAIYAGAKIKYLNSKLLNVSFGMATLNNAIDSIFSLVNTSIYLNNSNPANQINPYQTNSLMLRYGSDLRHSAIMGH